MDECDRHGMAFCAVCNGLDVPPRRTDVSKQSNAWTPTERAIAANSALSSAEVADHIGRSVSNVAAYRIAQLHMTDWKDNHHRRALVDAYPFGRGNQGPGTGPDGERLI